MKMSKEKETDAATVLSQMSQLVGVPTFDFSANMSSTQDVILEAHAIGATCTLQSSSIDSDILFPLSSQHPMTGGKKVSQDPYIGFDDSEHPYAANFAETNSFVNCKQRSRDTTGDTIGLVNTYLTSSNPNTDDLTCMVCAKRFKTHHNLLVHLKFHDGKKPHTCVLCSKSFTTNSDLKRHFKVHCKDSIQMLKCEQCGTEFRDRATRTRHMKIHCKSTALKCEVCVKEFSRRDTYNNHMKSHLTKKPFTCNICLSGFTYKSSYNRHVLAHENETLFICDVCGRTFRRADYVESHKKKVHRPDKEKSKGNLDESEKGGCLNVPLHNSSFLLQDESEQLKTTRKPKRRSRSKKKINAVPILMSMAENAAKPNKQRNADNSDELIVSELICQDTSGDVPSPNIGSDLIAFINNDSSEDVMESDYDDSCPSSSSSSSSSSEDDSEIISDRCTDEVDDITY